MEKKKRIKGIIEWMKRHVGTTTKTWQKTRGWFIKFKGKF